MILRNTAYKTIIGLTLGAGVLFLLKGYQIVPLIMVALGFLCLVSKKFALLVDTFMERLIGFIGQIISMVILAALYYLMLTPWSIVSRLFGNRDVMKKRKPEYSNYVLVEKVFSNLDFEKLW